MPRSPVRIALDIGRLHFLETYRASALLGVFRYAANNEEWQLLYNDAHFSLIGKYRTLADLPRLRAAGIITSWCNRRKADRIRRLGLSAVSLSNDEPIGDIPVVLSDDQAVGRLGAEHFLERAYRSVGFCGSLSVPWDAARWSGFAERCRAGGLEPLHFESRHTDDPAQNRAAARALQRWLAAAPKPFAVLGADDTHAYQVLDIASRAGLRVPQDVAILGVDDNPMICSAATPTLSSIALDPYRVGYRAGQVLGDLLRGAEVPPVVLVPPQGVQTRRSTDYFASPDPALAAAVEFIREHLGDPIGVVDIARAAGVSRRTLEGRFVAGLGTTVADALRDRRLARARALLLDVHLGVGEVAARVGYRTASHFCASFKRATGESPLEWRARELSGGAGGG